jgi:hypothetical protein
MSSDSTKLIDLGGFAATLNSRLAAEARLSKAIAFGWMCGGVGIAILLTGLGVTLSIAGYSQIISIKPAADEVAKALVNALQSTKLKANVEGTMTLSPNSELRLAEKQQVKLVDGAVVKLDPSSSVRVIGNLKVDVPQPSTEQLQTDKTSKNNDLPITDYTIFRSVEFEAGRVVSGWACDLSDTVRPKFEYCYYTQLLSKGLEAKYTLAINGSAHRPSELAKTSFDFDRAVSNCLWFSGY